MSEKVSTNPYTKIYKGKDGFSLTFFTYMVLKYLDQGLTPKKIMIRLGVDNLNRVLYHIKKLEKLGLIKRKFRTFSGTYYILTREGKDMLIRLYDFFEGEKVQKFSQGVRLRLHGFGMRFPVFERGSFRWDRDWLLRNWVKRYADFGNVSVEETSKHIFIYVKELYGSNAWKLLVEAVQVCLRFASYFMEVTGYKLGPGEVVKDPEFAIEGHPVNEIFKLVGVNMELQTPEYGAASDKSPGKRESEYKGALAPEMVSKFMYMPEDVEYIASVMQNILHRINRLEENQVQIVKALDRITTVFERLLGGQGDQRSSDESGERGERPRPEGWYL